MNDTTMLAPTIYQDTLVDGFFSEVVDGLSQAQKTLPCKFLYDEEGSRLFNEICEVRNTTPPERKIGFFVKISAKSRV